MEQDLVILTDNEIDLIEKRIEILTNEIKKLLEEVKKCNSHSIFSGSSNNGTETINPEHCEITELIIKRNEFNKLNYILKNSKKNIANSDVITIGSEFKIGLNFNNLRKEVCGVLVSENIVTSPSTGHYGISSPLGEAINGLKENDIFHYVTPTGMIVNGVVEKIFNNSLGQQK